MATVKASSSATSIIIRKPCLKPGKHAPSDTIPDNFETKIGRLRVPRQDNPRKPDHKIIRDIRQGHLANIAKPYHVFPSSRFIGDVSPNTAQITLEGIYDYQSEGIGFDLSTMGEEKTLRNLFFISMASDELPSFHMWNLGLKDHVDDAQPAAESSRNPVSVDTQTHEDQVSAHGPKIVAQTAKGIQKQGASSFQKPTTTGNSLSSSVAPGDSKLGGTSNVTKGTSQQPSGWPAKIIVDAQKDNDSTKPLVSDKGIAQGSGQDAVRLHCQYGAMYLKDHHFNAFVELAVHLIREEDESSSGINPFVDVRQPATAQIQTYPVKSSRDATKKYYSSVKPYLGNKEYTFRIRSDGLAANSPWDSSKPGNLKVSRVDVGYCYINAAGGTHWNDNKERTKNGNLFQTALGFLFGMDKTPSGSKEKKPPDKVTLRILPNLDSVEITYSSSNMMTHELGKFLQKAYTSPIDYKVPFDPMKAQHSAEIFVHRSEEEFKNPPPTPTKDNETPAKDAKRSKDEPTQKITSTMIGELIGGIEVPQNQTRYITHSEVETLIQQRLDLIVESQEGQINYMAGENDDMVRNVDARNQHLRECNLRLKESKKQLSESSATCQKLGAAVNDLEGRVGALTRQVSDLQRQVETLQQSSGSTQTAPASASSQAQAPAPSNVDDNIRNRRSASKVSGAPPSNVDNNVRHKRSASKVPKAPTSIVDDTVQNRRSASKVPEAPKAAEASQSGKTKNNNDPDPSHKKSEPQKQSYCNVCLANLNRLNLFVSTKASKRPLIADGHCSKGTDMR